MLCVCQQFCAGDGDDDDDDDDDDDVERRQLEWPLLRLEWIPLL